MSGQRFTRTNPCPICGGHNGEPRGQERRCYGYLDDTGKYARCTREELAGDIERNDDDTYSHRLEGDCHCGKQHGAPAAPAAKKQDYVYPNLQAVIRRYEKSLPGRHVTTYEYRDENNDLVHVVLRFDPKEFRQAKPVAGGWSTHLNGARRVLYRTPELVAEPKRTVWVTEGEKDADRLASLDLLATTAAEGATKWKQQHSEQLRGRPVVILPDRDEKGEEHVETILSTLAAVARVKVVRLNGSKDVSDWLDAGHTRDELIELVNQTPIWTPSEQPRAPKSTLAEIEAIWNAWMATEKDEKADPYPLRVVLGAYAANRLEGEPVWTMIVGSSGGGKTEVVRAIEGSEHVEFVSDLSGPAALLSGTPKQKRANSANGGLLRKLGEFGVVALKDFTTVLEMHREKRAEILAALREIHDGAWYRDIGTDGGQRLSWQGKLGLVAGCTTAIDANHGVMAEMGPRFLLARLPEVDRRKQGCRAVRQSSREKAERERLRLAVRGMFENLDEEPAELDDKTVEKIVDIADLVALARSPVQRDYRGDLELVHDPEAPTRISKQLAQLYRGLRWIGLDEQTTWHTVARVAGDSIPKLRGLVLRCLAGHDAPLATAVIGRLVDHPTQSTRRALEELNAHHVADRMGDDGQGKTYTWSLSGEARDLWRATFPETSSSMGNGLRNQPYEGRKEPSPTSDPDKSGKVQGEAYAPSDKSGKVADDEDGFDWEAAHRQVEDLADELAERDALAEEIAEKRASGCDPVEPEPEPVDIPMPPACPKCHACAAVADPVSGYFCLNCSNRWEVG